MFSTALARAPRRVRGLLVLLLAAVLLLQEVRPADAAPSVQRVAGADRVVTTVEASARGWPDGARRAVLATSGDFPDALAAAPLAAQHDAPLLLTQPHGLPRAVADELLRLDVDEVLLLGGTAAVSDVVVDQVAALPSRPRVSRVAGSSRYDTAAEVAREVGVDGGEVVLAFGYDFPDAVSAGALAASPQAPPVLLTTADRLPSETRDVLEDLAPGTVTVVGGPAVVGDRVVAELDAMGLSTRRLAGANRYATSAAVAEEALDRLGGGSRPAIVATGESHPDALAAGVLTARFAGVLVLAHPRQPESTLDTFLRERTSTWSSALVMGGPSALGDGAVAAITRSLRGEAHPRPEPQPAAAQPTPGEIAVQVAREQIGAPYRYGGTTPSGFDCSGLTSYAWRAAGVTLPRISRDQFARYPRVSRPRPGDIVAYGNPVHHVAIYSGSGRMIEAPRSGLRVREVPVRTSGLRGYVRPGG